MQFVSVLDFQPLSAMPKLLDILFGCSLFMLEIQPFRRYLMTDNRKSLCCKGNV